MKREKSVYIMRMISSVLVGLGNFTMPITIVIFVGQGDIAYYSNLRKNLIEKYADQLNSGRIMILCASKDFYPDYLFNNGIGRDFMMDIPFSLSDLVITVSSRQYRIQ